MTSPARVGASPPRPLTQDPNRGNRPLCPGPSRGRAKPRAVPLHQIGNLTGSHAATESERRDTEPDQFIKPVAHPIAAPETQIITAERDPELPQIPQPVERSPRWRQTTR